MCAICSLRRRLKQLWEARPPSKGTTEVEAAIGSLVVVGIFATDLAPHRSSPARRCVPKRHPTQFLHACASSPGVRRSARSSLRSKPPVGLRYMRKGLDAGCRAGQNPDFPSALGAGNALALPCRPDSVFSYERRRRQKMPSAPESTNSRMVNLNVYPRNARSCQCDRYIQI